MAHSATISSLTDRLVEACTGCSTKEPSSRKLQRYAINMFKESRAGQTNQFAIQEQLAGLEEKFRVYNNDELADAFHSRVQAFSAASFITRWKPEILSLLLQLSDNPLGKTAIEDLELLRRTPSPPPLTWEQIFQDVPLDNRGGMWDNVDFAADSSEDDDHISPAILDRREPATTASDPPNDDVRPSAYDELRSVIDFTLVNQISQSRIWNQDEHLKLGDPKIVFVSENQMIREVLNVLRGLPSPLYTTDGSGYISPSKKYRLKHVSEGAIGAVLRYFVPIIVELAKLRTWARGVETVALTQSVQAAIQGRLREMDKTIANIDAQLLKPTSDSPITMLTVINTIQGCTRLIIPLTSVIPGKEGDRRPFEILERLFTMISDFQSIGDTAAYRYVAEIFFECFQTYLKPIRIWMERGEIESVDDAFFITRNKVDLPLPSLWSDQYILLHNEDGSLHAPSFLRLAAKRIFSTGKSIAFLGALGQAPVVPSAEKILDFVSVCSSRSYSELSPFVELFATAFAGWIASKHQPSLSRLRETLISRCGLWRSLDALEFLFLDRNGALSDQIATFIFDRIDRGNKTWQNRFILTQNYREVFSTATCVSTDQLSILVEDTTSAKKAGSRSIKSFSEIRIHYTLPWAVSNIVRQECIPIYQRISTFLLQIRRAKQLLEKQALKGASPDALVASPTSNLIFSLRHRLLWFASTIQSYLTGAVLAVATADMRTRMGKAIDPDDMIAIHDAYIRRLEMQCMVSAPLASTHTAVIALLDLAVSYADACAAVKLTQKNMGIGVTQSDSSDEAEAEDDGAESRRMQEADSDVLVERLRKIRVASSRLLGFVLAGAREVQRSTAEPCWEILVDNLSFGMLGGRVEY